MDNTQGWPQRGEGPIQSGVAPDPPVGVATALQNFHELSFPKMSLKTFQRH
jgi:hypothetical protein